MFTLIIILSFTAIFLIEALASFSASFGNYGGIRNLLFHNHITMSNLMHNEFLFRTIIFIERALGSFFASRASPKFCSALIANQMKALIFSLLERTIFWKDFSAEFAEFTFISSVRTEIFIGVTLDLKKYTALPLCIIIGALPAFYYHLSSSQNEKSL